MTNTLERKSFLRALGDAGERGGDIDKGDRGVPRVVDRVLRLGLWGEEGSLGRQGQSLLMEHPGPNDQDQKEIPCAWL